MKGKFQKNPNKIFQIDQYNQIQSIPPLRKIPSKIRAQFEIKQWTKFNEQQQQFICELLFDILQYPDNDLAELHRQANRLGSHDLKQSKKNKNSIKSINKKLQNNKTQQNMIQITQESMVVGQLLYDKFLNKQNNFCSCCGFIRQNEQIPLYQDFSNFPTIGLSTFLYFQTVVHCGILLVILFFVYSIFTMIANYYVKCKSLNIQLFDGFSLIVSDYDTLFSTQAFQNNYFSHNQIITRLSIIEAFLIMATVIISSFASYIFKHLQIQNQNLVDDSSVTASDFSVMIENVPIQMFKNISNVQEQIDQYIKDIYPYIHKEYFQRYKCQEKVINLQKKSCLEIKQQQKFKIQRINIGIPFYLNVQELEQDEQFKSLNKKQKELKQKFIDWVRAFFENKRLPIRLQHGNKKLKQYRQAQQQIKKLKNQLVQKIMNQLYKTAPDEMTTTVFVSFNSALGAKIIYELNPSDFLSKIRYILTLCNDKHKLKLTDKNGKVLPIKISRAPQPQDIKWQNIGFSFKKILFRKFFTFFITTAILFGSFFLIKWLSDIQLQTDLQFISIIISISITIINVIIGEIIRHLTLIEKDLTQTNHQASLSLKSIFALLINTIMIPVLIKTNNIYGQSGLVQDVFFLVITCAFLDPILKYFDIAYYINRFKYWLKLNPYRKIGLNQTQLNQYAINIQFQLGFQYIYIANLYLITCFFTPLQPIIPLFSILGILVMYWIQKYCLLKRVKRPIPGSETINEAVGQIITLGPVMLAVGSLVFSDILTSHDFRGFHFLINFITVFISIFFYIIPFKIIYRLLFSQDEYFQNLNYYQNRAILPSQYDRLNPTTNKQAIQDFKKYLQKLNQAVNGNKKKSQNSKVQQNLNNFKKKMKYEKNKKVKINSYSENSNLLNSLFVNMSQSIDVKDIKLNKKSQKQNNLKNHKNLQQDFQQNEPQDRDQGQYFRASIIFDQIQQKQQRLLNKKDNKQQQHTNQKFIFSKLKSSPKNQNILQRIQMPKINQEKKQDIINSYIQENIQYKTQFNKYNKIFVLSPTKRNQQQNEQNNNKKYSLPLRINQNQNLQSPKKSSLRNYQNIQFQSKEINLTKGLKNDSYEKLKIKKKQNYYSFDHNL